jgi:outer membrane protein OmpA-like peptidoglycan-associated protein
MSQKFRLFASVAVPFVSLPLMIQPAAALPLKPLVETSQMPGLVQVQEEDPLVPRKRKAQEEEGGAEQQKQGGGERKQAPQAQQEEQPRRQRQAEPEAAPRQAPAAEAPAQERPRRQQADQDQGGSERPQRRQQQADQDQGEGVRPPRRQQQTDQDQGDSQQPQRRQQQAAPETKSPATQETEQLRPPVAPEGGERPRRNAQDRNAAPAEKQAETPKPPRANDRAATPETPERPPRGNAQGQAPAPDDGTAQGIRPPQPATDSPATGTRQAQDPQLRRQQPAEGQQTAPSQEQPAQQQAQPEQPRTPEQVDRARQIARDPASAREGEQVVLPVENGAAVLDSAKERPARPRRDGERPRRQPAQEAEQQQLAPPKSDAEAQSSATLSREQEQQVRTMIEERGERLDSRPQFERPQGWRFGEEISRGRDRERDRDGARVIISIDDQNFVRHDDSRRFYDRDGRQPEYERLRDGQVREVIVRDDGTRIVTVRNRYGEIVRRTRVVRGGEEYVLYYAPELVEARRGPDYVWRDPGEDLPPMRLTVPIEDYIIDTSSEPDRDYYEFLEQPPVERVERVYTLDEVRYSARIRDKVPRIDLDTITFATGSAEIPMNQASSLRKVADAINKVLEKDPAETFLIEGHTDAVGPDQDNLILSDERAESVARVLTDAFAIPPENLTTQGYGEQYLKVRTDGPNQENRRVTVRRITPLVKPVASKQ